MLAMSVNLRKRLYFYKVWSGWFRVGSGCRSPVVKSIAEKTGHGWDAIESFTASEVDVGEIE